LLIDITVNITVLNDNTNVTAVHRWKFSHFRQTAHAEISHSGKKPLIQHSNLKVANVEPIESSHVSFY